MDVYTTEEQQVEAIKKWWRENRWSLLGGVVLGIALIIGGRSWIENRNAFNETASAVFQTMNLQIAQGQLQDASDNGSLLLADFADTPYAALAALGMAKIKVEQGEPEAAIAHLKWVLDNADDEAILHEARLRTGRLLLEADKAGEALALLNSVEPGTYAPAYDQLKGDIQVASGDTTAARESYARAMSELSPNAFSRQILQMKLDQLGGAEAVSISNSENNS